MLNYCRLYLGAVTLSDLATPGGIYLDNAKLRGSISRLSSTTRWLRIHRARPLDAVDFMAESEQAPMELAQRQIEATIERWLQTHDERRMVFPPYVHRNILPVRIQDEFRAYEIDATGRQIGPQIQPALRYADLHPAATPADVYEASDGHWTVQTETTVLPIDPVPEYQSFHGYIQTLPP
jgi:hypothetical protein